MLISIGKLVWAIASESTDGNIMGNPVTALMSRATPQCDAASARFGVKPISKTKSAERLKKLAAGVPLASLVSNTKIPSCEVPIPISSSAQIIPSEGWPYTFRFSMVNKALPSASNKVVPGVATITFWPAATLAAPQTMVKISDNPASTVVRLSVFSFTSNFSHVKTSATTNPFNPPGIFSCLSIPSTSNPVFVNNTSNSSASPF